MSRHLLVGQSGGPTAVINSSLAGVINEAQQDSRIEKVLGMRRGVDGMLSGDIVDLTAMSAVELDTLSRTPGAALGACRRRITEDEAEKLVSRMENLSISSFCYIGGNDSADTTHKIALAACTKSSDITAVAVPKTIDNDLPETDHCPGFGSIARYVAVSTAESALDTRSLPSNYPIKILEVMGRDAGWVAASAGLARRAWEEGPHLIYGPERAFSKVQFLDQIKAIHRTLGYVVAVVAETVRDADGNAIAADLASVDDFGHPIIRGTAEALVRLVESELGLPARFDRPGTLQRSSYRLQSSTDRDEARDVGREAVRLVTSGLSDRMVTIRRISDEPYTVSFGSVELSRIANRQKLLPSEYLDSSGNFITDGFRQYALPLLGPNPFPDYLRL